MADDGRILWERDKDCLCGARLRGEELGDGTTGQLRLTREVRGECPRHGIAEDMMEAAINAAETVIATVPGTPNISRPQLRRMVLAALPIIQAAVASGTFPMPTTPPAAPVDPAPADPAEPRA